MKKYYSFWLLACIVISLKAQENSQTREIEYPFAAPGSEVTRGIFGWKDDRKEVKDAEGYEDFVRATAVMISKSNIYNDEFYSWSLRERLQRQFGTNKFDENVKFLDQPAIGSCTGFLIAPDILVTAGHCIRSLQDAKKYVWVFDYTSESKFINGRKLKFKPENIYEVESIIVTKLDDRTKDDYAFLRLRRKSNRDPYRFRTSGKVLEDTKINTIGSPTGLPLKFTTNAVVVDNKPKNWFLSSLDNFPGNSGGPVFDQNGFIEGILVRGRDVYSEADGRYTGDYKYNLKCKCIQTVSINSIWEIGDCQSHKITEVPTKILIEAVYQNIEYAIKNNLEDRFNSWSIYNWIFNHKYTKQQGRFENLAIEQNNTYALKQILKITAESMSDQQARQLIDFATSKNNDDILQILLESGLLADAGLNSTYTSLQNAVIADNLSIAETLIFHGADTKIKTNSGDNLLHLAARNGSFEMAKLLVKNGVDAGAKNNNKRRPEKVAKKSGHKSLAKYLKKARKGRL